MTKTSTNFKSDKMTKYVMFLVFWKNCFAQIQQIQIKLDYADKKNNLIDLDEIMVNKHISAVPVL